MAVLQVSASGVRLASGNSERDDPWLVQLIVVIVGTLLISITCAIQCSVRRGYWLLGALPDFSIASNHIRHCT
jgi:hypothetical protein